jgi:hypothetical protein
MKKIERVYVAGAYSADNVITVLDNMREGIRLSVRVMLEGFSPFSPWLDYHFQLMLRGDERLTVPDYYKYSMRWLEVSDAVLLVPGWESSKGTLKELQRARELDIPVFYYLTELLEYVKNETN